MDREPALVAFEGCGVAVTVTVAPPTVDDPEVLEALVVIVAVLGSSVASKTIRTPYAFTPCPDVRVENKVDVVPSMVGVYGTIGQEGEQEALQVQNRVDNVSVWVQGELTQDRVMLRSALEGQQVTVVMLATPALSWQPT